MEVVAFQRQFEIARSALADVVHTNALATGQSQRGSCCLQVPTHFLPTEEPREWNVTCVSEKHGDRPTLRLHRIFDFHLDNNDSNRESTPVDVSRLAFLTSYLLCLYEPSGSMKVTHMYPSAGRHVRLATRQDQYQRVPQSDVFL